MTFECENCDYELDEETFEEWAERFEDALTFDDFMKMAAGEVEKLLLVDCPNCEEELATYKKKDTTDLSKSEQTNSKSKMLEAARKEA